LLPDDFQFPELNADRWHALAADPAVTMLVAEEDDQPLGVTVCGESRDDDVGPEVGEIRTLFVAVDSWGRGVGGALVNAALEDLRIRGCTEATVWSFADNERANRFYESQGFIRDGAERTEPAWADLADVRYRRSL
jgi:GNAT superfamily N-acetyltransferase